MLGVRASAAAATTGAAGQEASLQPAQQNVPQTLKTETSNHQSVNNQPTRNTLLPGDKVNSQ